jgi:hypothetical protein
MRAASRERRSPKARQPVIGDERADAPLSLRRRGPGSVREHARPARATSAVRESSVAPGPEDGVAVRLAAENDQLASRLRRLAPLLACLVADLAASRRENARLLRESATLRAQARGSG